MTINEIDPYKVGDIKTLGKYNDKDARALLDRVALQVQPILRKRQYVVPVLKEFFPRNPNLQGINVGGGGGRTIEICLRLRPANSENSFLPYEFILKTMLHEITHNFRGPHDAIFYKLMDELVAECEDYMSRGITGTGAGFDANAAGKVGGSRLTDGTTRFNRRTAALRAAETRAKKQSLLPTGPQKLGGDITLQTLCNPREAAVIAAERRMLDNAWCPTERIVEDQAAGTPIHDAIKAVFGNGNNDIDLTGIDDTPPNVGGGNNNRTGVHDPVPYKGATTEEEKQPVDPTQQMQVQQQQQQQPRTTTTQTNDNPPAAVGRQKQPNIVDSSNLAETSAKRPKPSQDIIDLTALDDDDEEEAIAKVQKGGQTGALAVAGKKPDSDDDCWTCSLCTLVNKPLALQCEACLTVRTR